MSGQQSRALRIFPLLAFGMKKMIRTAQKYHINYPFQGWGRIVCWFVSYTKLLLDNGEMACKEAMKAAMLEEDSDMPRVQQVAVPFNQKDDCCTKMDLAPMSVKHLAVIMYKTVRALSSDSSHHDVFGFLWAMIHYHLS